MQPGLFVVEVGQAHIVVVVGGGKAQLPAQGQSLVQRGGRAGAEGLSGLRVPLYALYVHQPGDGADQFPLPGGVAPIGFDLFLMLHVVSLVSVRLAAVALTGQLV